MLDGGEIVSMFILLKSGAMLNLFWLQDCFVGKHDNNIVIFYMINGSKVIEEYDSAEEAQKRVEDVQFMLDEASAGDTKPLIVDELPTENISKRRSYLIRVSDDPEDGYQEWRYIEQPDGTCKWEMLGVTKDYSYSKEDIDNMKSEIDGRLDGHDTDIDNINIEIGNISNDISAINDRLDNHDMDISGILDRLDTDENDIEDCKERLDSHDMDINSLNEGVESISNDINTINDRLDGHDTDISNVTGRVDTAEMEITDIKERLDGHDDDIGGINDRLEGYDNDISSINGRLDNDEEGISVIEGRLDSVDETLNTYGNDIESINGRLDNHDTDISNLENTKQDNITNDNKLLSDLVDDTNQTHKFVTEQDKTNWNNKTTQQLNGTNGKALIFNEVDGGGSKFEHTDGTMSYVGTNDGGENGIAGQLYVVKKVNNKNVGTRLNMTKNGFYYTNGANSASYTEDDELVVKRQLNAKTDKELNGTSGRALMFNEIDGGGAKFEHIDGTMSFVGVNDGGKNGITGQLYSFKMENNKNVGTRLNMTTNGFYYTNGNDSATYTADDELATKGDINSVGQMLEWNDYE